MIVRFIRLMLVELGHSIPLFYNALCLTIQHFSYSFFFDGHLGCSQVLLLQNNTTVKILICLSYISLYTCMRVYLKKVKENRLQNIELCTFTR